MNNWKYPPEWNRQTGTILIFPKKDSDWNCCFDEVQRDFLFFIKAIAKFQTVYLILEENIDIQIPNVEIIQNIKTDDTWARDSLALTIIQDNGKKDFIDFQFNGWGNKFPAYFDNRISEHFFQDNLIFNPFIIDGGAIETDGDNLLVTRTSILNKNRYQFNRQEDIEVSLKKYLGVSNIIWLENSFLAGDDTDGHIDMLARFGENNEVFYSLDNIGDEIKLHLPNKTFVKLPHPTFKNTPATYLNFIFVNGGLLIPTYKVKEDEEALKIFQIYFPTRKIIPIDSRIFIQQGGSLHCLTMQS